MDAQGDVRETHRRRRVDAALWAALCVPVLAAGPLGFSEPLPPGHRIAALAVLAAATVLGRARPVLAFLLVAALALATGSALLTLETGAALTVFALLLGVRAERAGPAPYAFGAVLLLGLGRSAVRGVDPVSEALVLVSALLLVVVFPWLCGRHWRQRRALAEAGWARAAQLEREQRIVADRARLRERARIAQEVHDCLGHELSLIALRAGALQLARDLPERHRRAAAELRSAAADATDRLHAVIGLLREPDEPVPLEPAPTDSIESLVRRAAASGMTVRTEHPGGTGALGALGGTSEPDGTGEPDGADGSGADGASRSPLAEQLARSVVREALTNAAKHAPGAPVTVRTERGADGTTVTVTSGAVPPPPPNSPTAAPAHGSGGPGGSGGFGLPGLRARVTALGGTFTAGRHGTGFRVHARLPGRSPAGHGARTPYRSRLDRLRRVPAVVAVPALGALFFGGALAWYAYAQAHSTLEPAAYAALRPGATLDQLRPVLPDRAAADPPVDRAPPRPAAAGECRYYRADGELFTMVEHFRLCFDRDGVLVAKDVVPRARLAGEGPTG
ncbi:histidine kinase [Streptomyces sp. NPDC005955]|uniref:sensor histidine kinase n=1 Tax=Streptomyces sp. NPDC005955 TaxID=3364738 RepID=UPI00368566B3